ncbi:hypothetical protein SUDANB140_03964 [Streptomyces sp. enrichment culture]
MDDTRGGHTWSWQRAPIDIHPDISGALSHLGVHNQNMSTATYELLAASDAVNVTVAFILGLVIAGALIAAVRMGMRVMERESDRPRAEDQPHLPASGPVHEEREMREPDEIPLNDGGSPRLMPYELHHSGSRRCDDQKRRRWLPGSSGAFGSGGPGHV